MIWIPKKISFNKKDLKIVLYNIKIILIYEYIKIFINFMYYIWEIQIGKVIQKWSKISIINLKGSLQSINYEFPNNGKLSNSSCKKIYFIILHSQMDNFPN